MRGVSKMATSLETIKLAIKDELRLAEEQTPGHVASRGPGDTITLTPRPEYIEEMRQRKLRQGLGRAGELGDLVDQVA